MNRALTLLPGLLLLAVVCGLPQPGLAQQQTTDELDFAGGTRFQFLIPLSGMGLIQATVTLSPASEAEAFLFSPAQKTPLTTGRGHGTLTISYPVSSPSSGEWMLEVIVRTEDPSIRGTVQVSWPALSDSHLV